MATMRPRRAGALLVTGLLFLPGCRDGAPLFLAADREGRTGENPLRLTYGSTADRSPSWSPGGDSIYYAAVIEEAVRPIGVLRAIPAAGGEARPMLGALQAESAARRWLTTPAPSPDGTRLAYAEVWATTTKDLCIRVTLFIQTACEGGYDPLAPFLAEGRVRVRGFGAVEPVEQDPMLALPMAHFELDRERRPFGSDGVHIYRAHPFQAVWRTEGTSFYRPTWAPDGRRVATSDGLRILIWNPDAPAPTP
ncbi:MAG TPA: hypothetical protein VMK65_09820, partial [Longimicrobiales bacterium]|nr:hypothetical protein [Longimicrobiales bacterium]